jgi:GxxExxY protein
MSGLELNAISEGIIGAGIAVHRELGPGLLESCYEACLEYELLKRGFGVKRQVSLPVVYDSVHVECGFRIDLLVNDEVIVELKATEKIERIHEVQLLTYLKLTKKHLGLIVNFNAVKLVDGVKRIVREFPE